jgi:hypothetical protein
VIVGDEEHDVRRRGSGDQAAREEKEQRKDESQKHGTLSGSGGVSPPITRAYCFRRPSATDTTNDNKMRNRL